MCRTSRSTSPSRTPARLATSVRMRVPSRPAPIVPASAPRDHSAPTPPPSKLRSARRVTIAQRAVPFHAHVHPAATLQALVCSLQMSAHCALQARRVRQVRRHTRCAQQAHTIQAHSRRHACPALRGSSKMRVVRQRARRALLAITAQPARPTRCRAQQASAWTHHWQS